MHISNDVSARCPFGEDKKGERRGYYVDSTQFRKMECRFRRRCIACGLERLRSPVFVRRKPACREERGDLADGRLHE